MKIILPGDPISVLALLLRTSFGLSLMFVGIAHLTTMESFLLVTEEGFEFISWLAKGYAYLHPLLLVFGGGLLVSNRFPVLAAWVVGAPLCIIPVGMLSKTIFGLDLADMMAAAINAWIWLTVFVLVLLLNAMAKHGHVHVSTVHLPHLQ